MRKRHYMGYMFLFLFYFLNILNTYFVTTSRLNRYVVSFDRTFLSELVSTIGNFAALSVLIALLFMAVKKTKARMIALIALTAGLNFAIYSLGIFTRYYQSMFSIRTLSLFKNPAQSLGISILLEALKEIILYYRFVVFLPTVILLVVFFIIKYQHKKANIDIENLPLYPTFKYALGVTLTLGTTLMAFTISLFQISLHRNWQLNTEISLFGSQRAGLYNYYLVEILGFNFAYDDRVISRYSDKELYAFFNQYNKNKPSYINPIDGFTYAFTDEYTGLFEDKNLIYVQMESLNTFVIDLEVNGIEVAPYLNQLVRESYYFSNFYATVGQGNSADAEISTLTGLYPNGNSSLHWDYESIDYDLSTLAKHFNTQGYATASLHGDTGRFYNRENVHPGLFGFQAHYALEQYPKTPQTHPEAFIGSWLRDEYLFDWTIELAKEYQEDNLNFFLQPIMLIVHTPYLGNPMEEKDWGNEINGTQLARYLDFMAYQDMVLAHFIEEINTLDDTLVIFYSDHGSAINDGTLDLILGELDDMQLRRELMRVPAFIYDTSNTLPEMENTLVRSHIDLYRTVLNLFNLTPDNNELIFGVNALSQEPTFALDPKNLDFITDYYMLNAKRSNNYQLFDPTQNVSDMYAFVHDIMQFKRYSDIALTYNIFHRFKEIPPQQ